MPPANISTLNGSGTASARAIDREVLGLLKRQVVDAARAGQREQAYSFLLQLSSFDPGDGQVWRWRAYFSETRQEIELCLRHVLEIDPDDKWVRNLLVPAESRERVVLIVDDSPTVRRIVKVTLERHGARVMAAAGPMEALAMLSETVPDLILLDINMPHMDGYQLCKIVRANQLTCNVPVVMLSARDSLFDKMQGRLSGASDYITKPFEPAALIEALNRHCTASYRASRR